MKITLEQEQNEKELLTIIENEFGTETTPFAGITFIMPDGKFLDLRNYTHHSDVEKFLIDKGYSNYEYKINQGSQTMFNLGCIRCDTVKWYMVLPEKPLTSEQYESLLVWLDQIKGLFEVYTFDGQVQKYNLYDMISDDIVDKIRRFYIFGVLYEHRLT